MEGATLIIQGQLWGHLEKKKLFSSININSL